MKKSVFVLFLVNCIEIKIFLNICKSSCNKFLNNVLLGRYKNVSCSKNNTEELMLGSKTVSHFQRHRLPRYPAGDFKNSLIEIDISTKETIKAKPLNFSKYGLAFQIDSEFAPLVAPFNRIQNLRFTAFGQTFYEGPVEVRHSHLDSSGCTVGVFTYNDPIKVEKVLGVKIGHQIINGENGFKTSQANIKISEQFQLLVTQYQDYLLNLQQILEKTQKEIAALAIEEQWEIEQSILLLLEPFFKEKSDYYIKEISKVCKNFKSEEQLVYKSYFQSHLQNLLLVAAMPRRSVEKPLGYAGDYEMMNMIYERHYEGDNLFSKIQNNYWCSIPPARANILRLNYFKNKIEEVVMEALKVRNQVRITSLGSGPAKEIADFIKESPLSEHCVFTCVDQEPKALEYSQRVLTSIAKQQNKNVQFNFVLANVVSYLRSSPQQFMYEQDLLFASGLFDYLKQSVAKKLTYELLKLVHPQGELIIVNASSTNPGRIGMEFAGEWYLSYRSKEEMSDLVSELEGYHQKELFLDEEQVYWYLSVKK